ncbi:MAG TPA: hypothetical protein VNS22_12345 [Geminicoccus sp.]|uniref:hypothetical protein n=1 Tax=Geminicoccus sp. TaxID=2024832 RepID=UPI002CB56176|nr:hypothetical protein [Geminicoccus sp.]HWL69162.1 hypothetical protein [Geminicoccus sp.]
MDWTVLAPVLVEHLAIPVLVAIGGWLTTKIPGPLRNWLQADTHAKDLALITSAMGRAAVVAYADYRQGRFTSPTAAIGQVVAYVLRTCPETIAKLGPDPDTLQTMAHAIWDSVVKETVAAEAAKAVPDVVASVADQVATGVADALRKPAA